MYNEFYGFSENPFNLTPDPRFLYLAIGHYEALSSMIAGIKERKGITVITGEVGTGKTTLIYTLLKDLSEKIEMAFIFYTKTSFQDLLKNILAELDVPVSKDNLTSLLLLFRQYLKERMVRDEPVAIIIDEAQNLEIEVMEDLFRLCSQEAHAAKLVQILLVGQPELKAKLDSLRLRAFEDRVTVRNYLRPLDQKECGKYINHRLKVAGSRFQVFTPQAINRISEFSAGIPRVINILCDRALLMGYTTSTRNIDEGVVNEAIGELGHLKSQPTISLRRVRPLYVVLAIVTLAVLGLGTLHFLSGDSNLKPLRERREAAIPLEGRLLQKEAFTEKEKPMERPTERVVSVKKGWTLSLLAQQYYGNVNPTLLDLILELNPQITDLNRIFVDQQIRIPSLQEERFLIQAPDQSYRIHLGTFSDKEVVASFKDSQALRGKSFQIIPRKVSPQHTWFRVLAGEFATRQESLKAIQTLRQQGLLAAFRDSSE